LQHYNGLAEAVFLKESNSQYGYASSLRASFAGVSAAIVSALFIQAGNGLQTDLTGLRADAAFAPDMIGLTLASYYAGYCAAPLASRAIVGRLGNIISITVCMILAAGAILLQPLMENAPVWIVLRAVSGFAISLSYVAIESWINDAVPNPVRGRVFSIYMVMQIVGMTAAQGLLSFHNLDSFTPFLWAAALFAVPAVTVLLAHRPGSSAIPPRPVGLLQLSRLAPLATTATVIAGLSWAILFTFGPVYARRIGLNLSGISLFMGLAMAAGGALQLPAGWLSDVIGRRTVIGLLFGGGVIAALIGFGDFSRTWTFAAIALEGACVFPIYSMTASQIHDQIPREQRVAAAASLILLFGLGSLLGPLLCGWIMNVVGTSAFFGVLCGSMMMGLASVLLLYEPKTDAAENA